MPKKTNKPGFFDEKRCAKCGKKFVPAPYHAYKHGGKLFCTWTCYNHRNDDKKG